MALTKNYVNGGVCDSDSKKIMLTAECDSDSQKIVLDINMIMDIQNI